MLISLSKVSLVTHDLGMLNYQLVLSSTELTQPLIYFGFRCVYLHYAVRLPVKEENVPKMKGMGRFFIASLHGISQGGYLRI